MNRHTHLLGNQIPSRIIASTLNQHSHAKGRSLRYKTNAQADRSASEDSSHQTAVRLRVLGNCASQIAQEQIIRTTKMATRTMVDLEIAFAIRLTLRISGAPPLIHDCKQKRNRRVH